MGPCKKNSIFALYKEQIFNFLKGALEVFFVILVIAGTIACVFFVFDFELYVSIAIVAYVLMWLYVGHYYVVYWRKIQRIPLTKKELNNAGINSVVKFQNYLTDYMDKCGEISNKNVKALCFRCTFVLLTDENERIRLLKEYFNERPSKKEGFEIYLKENGIKNLKDINKMIAGRELNYSINSLDWKWLDQMYWDFFEYTEFDSVEHINIILSIRNDEQLVKPLLVILLVAIFVVSALFMLLASFIGVGFFDTLVFKAIVCPMCLFAAGLIFIGRLEAYI